MITRAHRVAVVAMDAAGGDKKLKDGERAYGCCPCYTGDMQSLLTTTSRACRRSPSGCRLLPRLR